MPPEGPNKAEELLQRYAKERRERGGDFSLHPATRRLLQGEVTRQFGTGTKERSGSLAWLGLWRGRFAIGVALAAVVVAGFWIFSNGSNPQAIQKFAKADSPRAENEFIQREVRLAETRKEVAVLRPTDPGNLIVGGRGLSDVMAAQTKSLSRRATGGETAASQDTKSPLQNVTLFDDLSAAPATNAFNYALALAPAQGQQSGQSQAAPASQLGFSGGLLANNTTAPQKVPDQIGAYGFTQLGSVVANLSPAVEATDRYFKQSQAPGLATLADEVQISKQVNSSASEQRASDTTMLRARQLNAPQVAYSTPPPPQATVPLAAAAPATAPVEEKLKRNEIAGIANSPQPTAAPAAARFYRVDNGTLGDQVAQRTTIDGLAKKAEPSKTEGTVLSQFTIEQQGTTIRWLEADGSVYEGTVGPSVVIGGKFQADFEAPTERDKDTFGREKLAELKAQNVNRGDELSFRVSGTNVTLQQVVTVNGRLSPATNGMPATAGTVTRRLSAQPEPRRGGTLGVSPETAVMIEGTVRIGVSNEQRFRAVRAPR
jgi:hypothetical protein